MSEAPEPAEEGQPAAPEDLFRKVRANTARDGVPAAAGAVNKPSWTDPMAEAPFFCRRCGAYAQFSGYAHPLCAGCREELSARPFPVAVWAFLAAFALVLSFALVRLPVSVAAGLAFERGQRAERRRDFYTAGDQYARVTRRFPGATIVLVRQAVVHAEAGRVPEALDAFKQLAGRTISNALIAELNRAEKKLEKAGNTPDAE